MVSLTVLLLAAPGALAAEGDPPAPGAEIALVLDMDRGLEGGLEARALRTGALLLRGGLGPEDHLTAFALAAGPHAPPQIALEPGEISGLVGLDGGDLGSTLRAGAAALWTSARADRVLALASAGPRGLGPDQARALLDLPGQGRLPVYGVAVGGEASSWLSRLVGLGDEISTASAGVHDQGAALALAVAGALAGAMDASPQRARLEGGDHPLLKGPVPVSALAVMLARPGGAPRARLIGPAGPVDPTASGVLPCAPDGPEGCAPLGYASFRVELDPAAPGAWSLVVPDGEVDHALILARPALRAALFVPDELEAGQGAPIALAILGPDGLPVADPAALLGAELYARAWEEHAVIALSPGLAGRFLGTWTPLGPTGRAALHARVQSPVVDLRVSADAWVEGDLAPILIPDPPQVDLGAWQGEWGDTRRCAEIDLSRSIRASGLRVLCRAGGRLEDARLTCDPAPDQAGLAAPRRWIACVEAEGCCQDLPTADDAPAELRFLVGDAPDAPPLLAVPVRYGVRSAGFWRCNFPALLATSALGLLLLGGLGVRTRRRRFSVADGLRFATSEPGLRRAAAVFVQRAARRDGLLGPDRVWVDEAGELCRAADGLLALEPGPAGAVQVAVGPRLERRLPAGTWEPVSEGERLQGLQPGVTYRVDERLYFMLAPG